MSYVKKTIYNYTDPSVYNNYILNKQSITYPTLYSYTKKGQPQQWDIEIQLKKNNKIIDINPDFLIDDYDNSTIDPKIHTYIYTRYGQIGKKITETEPTIITQGKNLGKKGETNVLTQGLRHVRSLYDLKIKKGYTTTLNKQKKDNIPYPMAVSRYDKFKQKIIYPCYIQPKLDGIRSIFLYEKNKIQIKARSLKEIKGFDYIKNELTDFFKDYPNIILDGELYKHGLPLQTIQSLVRNEDKANDEQILIFNIFDCYDTTNLEWRFKDRIDFLNDYFTDNNCKYIEVLETTLIENSKQGTEKYNDYLKHKYEGAVYKNADAPYEMGFDGEIRSNKYIKRKKKLDNEFQVIGYERGKSGKGKTSNIIFICKTKNGETFKVPPNATLDEQRNMLKKADENFDKYYKNKWATIEYEDLSKKGIPLRAKLKLFRDINF